MPLLPILIAPHPLLKAKARPVSLFDAELKGLVETMLATMYAAPGIGLAAPQIGVSKRIAVIDVADKDAPPAPLRLINPMIVAASEDKQLFEEGCLSAPDLYVQVSRHTNVKVAYQDVKGNWQDIVADGLLADCLQHEIDHLDGIMFYDRLSMLKRQMALKKLDKIKKTRGL